jgi:two-component system NtrC family response regulator
MIEQALTEAGGNRSQAAKKLGLSRQGLLNKISTYQISID